MSGKRLATAFLSVLLMLVLAPAGATVARPVLKCSWSGSMNGEISGSEDQIFLTFGTGHGQCGLDGSGPYDIVSMQGQGVADGSGTGILLTFDLTVHFQTRRISDGQLRSFDQSWSGVAESVFVVSGSGKKGTTGVGVSRLFFPSVGEGHVSIDWVF